jgi:SAM-dependent methyltransferase
VSVTQAKPASGYDRLRDLMPAPLRRWVQHYEAITEDAVEAFSKSLPDRSRVLDAGAGEGQYKHYFARHRYCGFDLGVGDAAWNYTQLDVLGDLAALPFRDAAFDACISIVTLEHVQRPRRVVCEMARALAPGGRILIVTPFEWEEHQQPHDYFRYTQFSLELMMKQAGLENIVISPMGGMFRLLSRRLFNALQFFPGPLMFVAAIFFVPPALVLPLFEPLDKKKNFTLGYICSARKPNLLAQPRL